MAILSALALAMLPSTTASSSPPAPTASNEYANQRRRVRVAGLPFGGRRGRAGARRGRRRLTISGGATGGGAVGAAADG